MWYTLWTEISVIILDIMRHMWPRNPCAFCGTRCGENMPCHFVQCAPHVNTHFQPKIIQKLLLSSMFGYFQGNVATYMHAKSYISLSTAMNPSSFSLFTAMNPSSFYGRMFFGSRHKKMLLTTLNQIYIHTSSEFSLGSHTERI